ncbi:MAG: hypothetical protein HQK49_16085 [Oligoflexia bacterium]|nr:hypothetical protein [Oligoflexia bacterium]
MNKKIFITLFCTTLLLQMLLLMFIFPSNCYSYPYSYFNLYYGMTQKDALKILHTYGNGKMKKIKSSSQIIVSNKSFGDLNLLFDNKNKKDKKKKLISALLIFNNPISIDNTLSTSISFYEIPQPLGIEDDLFPNSKRLINLDTGIILDVSLANKNITSFAIENPLPYSSNKKIIPLAKNIQQHIDDIKNADQLSEKKSIDHHLLDGILINEEEEDDEDDDDDESEDLTADTPAPKANANKKSIIDGFDFIRLE